MSGQPVRAVARAHDLDHGALNRHVRNHLPGAIRAAASAAVQEMDATLSRGSRRALTLDDVPPTLSVQPVANSGVTPAAPTVFDAYREAVGLRDRALAILATAEANGDAKTALTAIREARGVLEHLSRLEERNHTAGPAASLADSAEWERTRAAIIAALNDFPEARLAVAEALIATGALN